MVKYSLFDSYIYGLLYFVCIVYNKSMCVANLLSFISLNQYFNYLNKYNLVFLVNKPNNIIDVNCTYMATIPQSKIKIRKFPFYTVRTYLNYYINVHFTFQK